MTGSQAIAILRERLNEIDRVRADSYSSSAFTKWKRDTAVAIERIFTSDSRNNKDFSEIQYTPSSFSMTNPDPAFAKAHQRGLGKAEAVLTSMIDEINQYGLAGGDDLVVPNQLNVVSNICQRFHVAARQLRNRHSNRTTLEINDEYDVQDLLHSYLRLHFLDVRPEEWTPSYAGGSSRTDFLLKSERIVIEVKKTRSGLKDQKLGEELLIDRERYQKHPDCDVLVCFIYDPDGIVRNPAGLSSDLEDHSGSLTVRVIVTPSG